MTSEPMNRPPPGRPPRPTSPSIRGPLRPGERDRAPGLVRPRRWEPRRDRAYIAATWRFQRRLVQVCFAPTPVCLLYLFLWTTRHRGTMPPQWALVALLSSIGITLLLAFFFWRCPDCERILFRTSSSGAFGLFFLADPARCPECGAPLQPPAPPEREKNTSSYKRLR